jgi:hypothetical protein
VSVIYQRTGEGGLTMDRYKKVVHFLKEAL